MTEVPGAFAEIRLQPTAACRAWTPDHGCYSALEWERARAGLPAFRAGVESARLRISEALGVEGVDPLGLGRKLLIHESTASLSREAVREAGFVHLESASGIHLVLLAALVDRGLRAVYPRAGAAVRAGAPLALWAFVFALTGFRPGLVRPLVLVAVRALASRYGYRLRPFAPIAVALAFDAALGFFLSFGSSRTFAEWAPGELHYAAAWAGGILAYGYARGRGSGRLAAHAWLSLGSWLAVLPLDFSAGRFAPATPGLSLLTVEAFALGFYPALFGAAIWAGLGGSPTALQWAIALLNRGVGWTVSGLFTLGEVRELSEEWGTVLAVLFVLAGVGVLITRSPIEN